MLVSIVSLLFIELPVVLAEALVTIARVVPAVSVCIE
jgi:hypothetical protein